MRVLITGVKDGKSCVVEETHPTGEGEKRVVTQLLRLTLDSLPSKPVGRAPCWDLGVPPGILRWLSVWFAPNEFIENHSSNTFECHTVVAGSAELILDDGPHTVSAGDRIALPGVDHAWRTGPDGCTCSIIAISTPPREGGAGS